MSARPGEGFGKLCVSYFNTETKTNNALNYLLLLKIIFAFKNGVSQCYHNLSFIDVTTTINPDIN
jgi:hypothetical protein